MAYLVGLGLLQAADIVRGNLVIRDRSSRNYNVSITCDRIGYFVKQATDPVGFHTLASEAAIYRTIRSRSATLHRHVPEVVHADPELGVLVLRHLGDGKSLNILQVSSGRFSRSRAAELARFLASVHSMDQDPAGRDVEPLGLWAQAVVRPTVELVREASSANLQLVKIVQAHPDFGDLLLSLQGEWEP